MKHSTSGATLLEVMVALGILGLAIVGATQYFWSVERVEKRVSVEEAMRQLANRVAHKIASPSAAYLSLLDGKNHAYIECLLGSQPGAGCPAALQSYDPKHPNYFRINYPTSDNSIEPLSSLPDVEPFYYDINGEKCKTDDPSRCLFEVTTFFYVSCISDGSVSSACARGDLPSHVHLSYRVKQRPNTGRKLGRSFVAIPKRVSFVTLSASQIFGPATNSSCNTGAVLQGFTRTGKPLCTCALPYIQYQVGGVTARNRKGEICHRDTASNDFVCPQGTYYRGHSQGRAICVSPSAAFSCIAVTGQQAQDWGQCTSPGGAPDYAYQIRKDAREGCTFECSTGADGGTCSSDDSKDPGLVKPTGMSCPTAQRSILCCKRAGGGT